MSQASNSESHSNNNEVRTAPAVPNPEVIVKPRTRHFTAEYKQRSLQEAEACSHGERGALLHLEGLYSSHITNWRRQHANGEAQGLTPQKRGRKSDPQAAEIARLKRENERLKRQLQRAETIIDVQKKTFAVPRADTGREQPNTLIQVAEQLASEIGLTTACAVLNVPRSSLDRARQPQAGTAAPVKNLPVRQLSDIEREIVHTALNSERFQDCAPRQVYATLLDDGHYLCSVSTLYRILVENKEICERRDQLRHPNYTQPELLTTRPNQVWSWDITRIPGPAKWNYYYWYVRLDIFSRYVVGWLITDCESSALAQELILVSGAKQNIQRDQLTIDADRGGSMIAKPVALLRSDLGVIKSHSRRHVSNDNPFSESQFKT